MTNRQKPYEDFLDVRAQNGLLRRLKSVRQESPVVLEYNGKKYLNFSGNDYLGLSQHPALIERAQEWIGKYGAGSTASRLVSGNLDIFDVVEKKIAAFKKQETALIVASGYQANVSLLPAILDRKILGADPLVFSDKLNHASMHAGFAAAGVKQIRYRHLDYNHLEQLLDQYSSSDQPKFIVTETVFSMDGDVVDMARLCDLAEQYDAFLMVDEAHATGVQGNSGAGISAGFSDRIDLVMGTFSKGLGGFGAYIACSQKLKDYLVNACGGVIYTTALPPSILGAIDAALDIVPFMDGERKIVAAHAQIFREAMQGMRLNTGLSSTQIVPVMIGDADKAMAVSEALLNRGVWVVPIRPPTVPKGLARLRFSFSAMHSEEHVEQAIEAVKKVLELYMDNM